ncbi:DUF488 domain-containing protein [Opitutaceae bacterium TAV4]|nr:DUF488 domain-containing protein [Opitutaceae bacterium TAV4]RRK01759.1 DUF488 domain-containing protein [Opitutaceae bacterium TAV3]
MLFGRQRLLLSLLDSLGGFATLTDFQKLLFLYTTEWEQEWSYEFIPYKFGCFSFTSYADKRKLAEQGFLNDATDQQEECWQLSPTGQHEASKQKSLGERTRRFVAANNERGTALIRKIYLRHPYYATRSEILKRVLPSEEERQKVEAARPASQPPGLTTIGYEGRSLEGYLNTLLRDSVTLLCDVRRNPLSRKYGFSKHTLSHACEGVGIRYEHLPELGIASEARQELRTQADYDALFAKYERDNLPLQAEALGKIRGWILDGKQRVALTCYEAQPCQCHRHCVAEALERAGIPALTPKHL